MKPYDRAFDPSGEQPHAESLERRTLLKGLATGLASSLAVTPPAAASEPAPEQAGRAAAPGPSSDLPRLLDEHQRRTLASLAELLVPGSVSAGVVDLMDRVAAIETPVRQRELLNAIARFDHEAHASSGKRWTDLDDAEHLRLLQRDAEASAAAALRTSFIHLRKSVATTYFATEAGMKERGWTGRTAWTELPGCSHPASAHE
jgi:hypothetical protein